MFIIGIAGTQALSVAGLRYAAWAVSTLSLAAAIVFTVSLALAIKRGESVRTGSPGWYRRFQKEARAVPESPEVRRHAERQQGEGR